jgi:hypothetical protein
LPLLSNFFLSKVKVSRGQIQTHGESKLSRAFYHIPSAFLYTRG